MIVASRGKIFKYLFSPIDTRMMNSDGCRNSWLTKLKKKKKKVANEFSQSPSGLCGWMTAWLLLAQYLIYKYSQSWGLSVDCPTPLLVINKQPRHPHTWNPAWSFASLAAERSFLTSMKVIKLHTSTIRSNRSRKGYWRLYFVLWLPEKWLILSQMICIPCIHTYFHYKRLFSIDFREQVRAEQVILLVLAYLQTPGSMNFCCFPVECDPFFSREGWPT